MKNYSFYKLFLVALLMATGAAMAQGTITQAGPSTTSSFVRTVSSFDSSPDANFTGVSPIVGQDHVFEVGWAIRVGAASQEAFLTTPNTQNYSGNVSTIAFSAISGVSATEVSEVINTATDANGKGYVKMTLTLTNNSGVPVQVNLYHMLDMDLQLTAGNDQAVLASGAPYRISIFDAGTNKGEYAADDADAYLVRPFGATDLGAVLSNAGIDNFDNSGLPFGPGDFSAGFQWRDRNLDNGASASFTAYIAVNEVLDSERPAGGGSDQLLANGFEDGVFYTLVHNINNDSSSLVRFSVNSLNAPVATQTSLQSVLGCLTQRALGGYMGLDVNNKQLINITVPGAVVTSASDSIAFNGNFSTYACAVDPRNDHINLTVTGPTLGAESLSVIVGSFGRSVFPLTSLPAADVLTSSAYSNAGVLGSSTTLYGLDSENNELVSVDAATGTVTIIGPLGVDISSNPSGLVVLSATGGYALADGMLYSVDLTTGDLTPIGAVNFPPGSFASGLIYVP